MANRSERVRERVRELLAQGDGTSTQQLMEAARQVDPDAMEGVTPRQFNAGYVVPLKRGQGGGSRPKRRGRAAPGRGRSGRAAGGRKAAAPAARSETGSGGAGGRDGVRTVLLQFAQDISAAESRAQIVAVMSDLDRYVERILKAKG